MAEQHIPQITNDCSSGIVENEFAIADSWVIDAYVGGEWNGNSTYKAYFYSDTSGTQTTVSLGTIGDVYTSYCDFRDINFVSGIIYADSTCTWAEQNNSGIILYIAPIPSGDYSRNHHNRNNRFLFISTRIYR